MEQSGVIDKASKPLLRSGCDECGARATKAITTPTKLVARCADCYQHLSNGS